MTTSETEIKPSNEPPNAANEKPPVQDQSEANVQLSTKEPLVRLVASVPKLLEATNQIQEFKAKVLKPTDYILIGTGKDRKPYIKKSGVLKIALAFGISQEIRDERCEDLAERNRGYFFTYRAVAPNGRFADAVGSASTKEREFTHPEHDVRALAQTRACNRAILNLVGGGEVSAEEMVSDITERGITIPSERPVAPAENPVQEVKPPQPTEITVGTPQGTTLHAESPLKVEPSQPEPRSLASISDEKLASELMALPWRQNSKGNGWNIRWDDVPLLYRQKLAQKFVGLVGSQYLKLGEYSYRRFGDQNDWLARYAVNPPEFLSQPARTTQPVSLNSSKKSWKVPLANDFLPEDKKPTGLKQFPAVYGLTQYGMLNQLGDEISIVPNVLVNPDNGYFHWFLEGSAKKTGIVKPICDKCKLHYELSLDDNKLLEAIIITGGQVDYEHVKELADGAARTFQVLLEEAKP